jgi:hypothetical protein
VNARAEAEQRLGGQYEARVLEPSPPAVNVPPWFADDPVARGNPPPGRAVVSPVGSGDVRWSELAADDPELARWCAERWLAAWPRLPPIPPQLDGTRRALHLLAEQVISPARRRSNGKIGLRYTHGGFGTPFFGEDVQIRVEGAELVVQERDAQRRVPISSVHVAAEVLGEPLLPGVRSAEQPLEVDPAGAAFLGALYGFGCSVLEELRWESDPGAAASRVELWPEHFDIAVEIGSETAGQRAAFGVSPGDAQHPQPYAYVAPWSPVEGELWQADAFGGAELRYDEFLAAGDQREAVLEFFRARRAALAAASATRS